MIDAPSKQLMEWTADDRVRLNFHPAQQKAWASKARFVFMIAGTQGGKTSFGPFWLDREIQRKGQGDYIAATSSYDLFKMKMLPEIRNLFEGINGQGRYWAGDRVIEIRDPVTKKFWAKRADDSMYARIILRSASAEGGLEAATAKGAWLDEVGQDEFQVSAWEAVLRRLSLSQGRILGTTTLYNLGWLKQQVYDPWRAGNPDFDVIQFASTLNPLFPAAEMERARATLPDWKYRMFYLGEFTRPAGLIYNDYIDDYRENGGHLVHPFPLNPDWPRIVSIDPGAVNHAQIWWAHDTDKDEWYAYREKIDADHSTKERAAEIKKVAAENKERVIGYYIGAKGETQQRRDYAAEGLKPTYEPPIADVESGIDKVIEIIKQRRFYLFDTLVGSRDQFGRYSRMLDSESKPTEKIKDKEKFHFLDAIRYGATAAARPKQPPQKAPNPFYPGR